MRKAPNKLSKNGLYDNYLFAEYIEKTVKKTKIYAIKLIKYI